MSQPGEAYVSMGPCGIGAGNYNRMDSKWGGGNLEGVYTAGEEISFESCWSADHKGVYSLRICRDEALVRPFITAGNTPSSSEQDALERCFQDGVLPCTSVASNGAYCQGSANTGCNDPSWGCASNTDWFHSPAAGAHNDGSYNDGFISRDTVKLPTDFSSNHTLLSWRWD